MRRFLLYHCLLLAAFVATTTAQSCSASSQCPSSSPCCSSSGICGSGAIACSGGCQPLASYSGGSCLANPICTDKNLTFSPSDYNNPDVFRPILLYDGNSSAAPFTLDYGYLGAGPEGVLLELTAGTQTKIASTEFILYGKMELTARHTPLQGLVFTFITMSNIRDEIDNEQATADGSEIYTNFFSEGKTVSGSSATIDGGSEFNVSDWHTYGINWQAEKLQWTIDGKVVKTILASTVGADSFPRSPSQIQISVWAGGNATNAEGTIAWAGGLIDWTSDEYTSQGYYSAEIKSLSVTCGSQNVTGISTVGSGTTPTSWIYSGETSSSLNEAAFYLSTDPYSLLSNPSAGGTAGLPGYSTQSAFTISNKNAWDGSGDTSGLSVSVSKSSSSSTTSASRSKNTSSSKSSTSSKSSSNTVNTTEDNTTGGGWLDNNKTLSIAVPVAGAMVGLIAVWALAVCCMKRRRNARENAFRNKDPNNFGIMNIGNGTSSRKSSGYSKVEDDEEEEEKDNSPMGAEKVGAGYRPAVGPRPQPPNGQSRYIDSNTNRYSGSDQTNHYPSAGVRGPYTPAINAYTPAIAQTPAMRSHQQQRYTTPVYNTADQPRPASQQQYNSNAYTPQQQQQQQHQQQQAYRQSHPSQGYPQQQPYSRQGYPLPSRPQQQTNYAHQQQGPYRNY